MQGKRGRPKKKELTEEEKEGLRIVDLIKNNFDLFIKEIIGNENSPFQDEIANVISDNNNKKIAVALARGSGKSTILSFSYPCWLIAKDHNIRILIVSATQEASSGFVSQIVELIETNEKYNAWSKIIDTKGIGVTPQLKKNKNIQKKWTGRKFQIARESQEKDPTVEGVGLFGSILSKRCDVLIIDDIVTQENSATEEQRRKTIEWVDTTVLPVLSQGGRLICLGNTWAPGDFIDRAIANPLFDYTKKVPAILHEADRRDLWDKWANMLMDKDVSTPQERQKNAEVFYEENKEEMQRGIELLWPKNFNKEKNKWFGFDYGELYLERINNPYAFSRMRLCDTSVRPNQKIKEEWIEVSVRKGNDLKLQDFSREGLIMALTTAGLDLAVSDKSSADDTCLVVLDKVSVGNGTLEVGDYIIRNIYRDKYSPNQTRELVKHVYEASNPLGIRVESNAFQMAMVRDLEEMGIPVRAYHTGGEKFDPNIGVNSISLMMERGKFVIPYSQNDARTRSECSKLINEMRAWPDGHTGDCLMACFFSFSEMRDSYGGGYTYPTKTETIGDITVTSGNYVTMTKEEKEEAARQLDIQTMEEQVNIYSKQCAEGRRDIDGRISFF